MTNKMTETELHAVLDGVKEGDILRVIHEGRVNQIDEQRPRTVNYGNGRWISYSEGTFGHNLISVENLGQPDFEPEVGSFALLDTGMTETEREREENMAWLIESPTCSYLGLDGSSRCFPTRFSWTTHDKALRFTTQKQAGDFYDLVIHLLPEVFGFEETLGGVKFTEHVWLNIIRKKSNSWTTNQEKMINKEKLLGFLKQDAYKVISLDSDERDFQYWQGTRDYSVEIVEAIERGDFEKVLYNPDGSVNEGWK